MWHMQDRKMYFRFDFPVCFFGILLHGRGFSPENIEFSFLFFRVLWGGFGHDFAFHGGSPVRLGALLLVSSSLCLYFGGLGRPKLSQK